MLIVGITQGDPNGIGPEVIIKALAPEGMTELMTPVIFANKGVMTSTMQHLKDENFRFQLVYSAAHARPKKINLVHVGEQVLSPQFGQATPEAGESAYLALEAAVKALETGEIDVLVTAPINKSSIHSDDFHFPGHTEYLEARFNSELEETPEEETPSAETQPAEVEAGDIITAEEDATVGPVITQADEDKLFGPLPRKAQMILFNDDLRVALLTTHLPLAEISSHITKENIIEAVRRFDKTLRSDFGCDRPRIAVLALNPHAGDNGLLGKEENEVIIPALNLLRSHGVLAFGPYAADGFFGMGEWKKFDGILAMYHDQGLAPFKTIAGAEGVNFTAGLEYIRTSPDHGTAYDIAGQMVADPTSMREAIYKAIDIYRNRDNYEEMTANPLKVKTKN